MKTLKYIALAALTISFAACEQEEYTPSVQGDPDAVKISATIGALQTRVAYYDNGVTKFEPDDKIRVINQTRQGKNKSDAVYKFGGTLDWEPAESDKYVVWESITDNTFYGVYPHTADYDKFTIPTNQSGGVQVADWMTDDFTADKSVGKVQFNFQHRLAKVTVKITKWNDEFNGVSQTIKYPKIRSTCQSVEITYGTGDNGTNRYLFRGNSPFIDPANNGDSYTAIVAPDSYISTQKFMSFSINGQDFNVLAGDNKVLTDGLQPGMHYTFSLTVGKNAVTIESVSVTKWDEQDINGGVAKECEHNFVDGICTECGTEAYTYDSSDNTY